MCLQVQLKKLRLINKSVNKWLFPSWLDQWPSDFMLHTMLEIVHTTPGHSNLLKRCTVEAVQRSNLFAIFKTELLSKYDQSWFC